MKKKKLNIVPQRNNFHYVNVISILVIELRRGLSHTMKKKTKHKNVNKKSILGLTFSEFQICSRPRTEYKKIFG